MRPDLYQLLAVDRSASEDEIKKAYRKQARRFHPDRNQGSGTDQRFKEVTYAYQVLSDPVRRAQYDRFGRVLSDGRDQGPFGVADEVDLAAMMGSMVRDLFGGHRKRKDGTTPQDLRYTVTISLLEAANGCQKEVQFDRRLRNGESSVEKLLVHVPPGVETGQKLKVRGKGTTGPQGDRQGDLYVLVNVAEHPYFKRRGTDLFCDLPITYSQSVLGAELTVATLQGPAVIRVPPATQPGAVLTLRGRGVRRLKRGRPGASGDLYVKVLLDMPTSLSESQKKQLLALDGELAQAPSTLRRHYQEALAEYARLKKEPAPSTETGADKEAEKAS